MVIKEVFFNHRGGKYAYRLNTEKIKKLCQGQFASLKTYLDFLIDNCPNHFFNDGPRSSCLRFKLVDNILGIAGHEISLLAYYGLEVNKDRYPDKHSQVQIFMLENDNNTLAMEVPIWLHPSELASYKNLFKSEEILTGHIDLLRIEDDKVWIWDYKPHAQKEKYAPTQIFFYAYMLSKRTGIPLDKFFCGYFDQTYAFLFKPQQDFLLVLNKQRNLF